MNEDASEILIPWSGPLAQHTLEFCAGDRPRSANAAENAMWAKRGDSLLFWANRRPDVAARVLTSSLFGKSPFTTGTPRAPLSESRLQHMCEHALAVHNQYYAQSAEVEEDPQRIPQEEVTFAASLMDPCLGRHIAPNICQLMELLFYNGASCATPAISDAMAHKESSAVDQYIRKPLVELISRHARGEGVPSSSTSEGPVPPPVHQLSIFRGLFSSTAWDTDLLSPPAINTVTREPVVGPQFRVRTREESLRQVAVDEAALTNATLVRAEGTIAAPWWDRDRVERQAQAERIAAEVSIAPSPAKEPDSAKRDPQPEAAGQSVPSAVETTWVKDGELVLVGWRFEVRTATQRKRTRKAPENDHATRTKHEAAPEGESTQGPRGMADETIWKDTETITSQSRLLSSHPTNVSSGEHERRLPSKQQREAADQKSSNGKRKAPSSASSTRPASGVSVHDVELKSREELLELVEAWVAPSALRDALVIGLEDPVAAAATTPTDVSVDTVDS